MLSDLKPCVHTLLERLAREGYIVDYELHKDSEGEYTGHAAVHMNGRLRKLGKFAKDAARVEKQSAAKMTKALMNEHRMATSKLGEYVGSSMGHISHMNDELNHSFDSPGRPIYNGYRNNSINYDSAQGSIHLKNPNESPSRDDFTPRDNGNPFEDSLYESSMAGDISHNNTSNVNMLKRLKHAKQKPIKTAQTKKRKKSRATRHNDANREAAQIYDN